ncbi:methyltransferase domain-containing protein [Chitinivorax sp. B]|uniref:class I SAM-dependent methyltransferase n=1 Tax=Chitinivorax sp. B TaxID=2502235 RepID=UPI0010F4563E|nr:methyltransferase domain-containing protein [Chitinivorax sp. B]
MPGYQVKYETVAIEGDDDLYIRSLLDRQQFSDPEGIAEAAGISAATWSLFGQVWPSSLRLAAAVAKLNLVGKRVLEIGCGLGLASLVVHRKLVDVTASDYHPLVGEFLRQNLLLNQLPPMNYQQGDWGVHDASLGMFDLIIGSDVLYERDHPQLLAGFIERHAESSMDVMIVDPNRGNRTAFSRQMASLGYDLTETRLDCVQADGEAYKGRMLHYSRVVTLPS